MLIEHDRLADCAYIYVADDNGGITTVEVSTDVNVDVDSSGDIVGVEIFRESRNGDLVRQIIENFYAPGDNHEHVYY